MVTYGDYFSRKVLHQCGVSPSETLLNKEESTYAGMRRTENIRLKMSEIYQTLYRGYAEKNMSTMKEVFDDLKIGRKIVSAFYDSGILNNAERDYFQTLPLQGVNEREQICVEEANMSMATTKSQKIDVQVKAPVERKISQ
jgi:UDP-galactopyranose mutase